MNLEPDYKPPDKTLTALTAAPLIIATLSTILYFQNVSFLYQFLPPLTLISLLCLAAAIRIYRNNPKSNTTAKRFILALITSLISAATTLYLFFQISANI